MYIFGQPVLRKVAEEIDVNNYEGLQELIQNMYETNKKAEGVGLAGPQVGKSIRLFIVDLDVISDDMPEYKGFLHAFINPEILESSEEKRFTSNIQTRTSRSTTSGLTDFSHEYSSTSMTTLTESSSLTTSQHSASSSSSQSS